ncbi:hypothetical protein EDB84DRAFT_346632 [Lactarius hengduanensis]|nr:hypothetical protein EDB84DRAFT_346632 [Lactarius hengduanensis]
MDISPLRSALRMWMWKHTAAPVEKNLVFYNQIISQARVLHGEAACLSKAHPNPPLSETCNTHAQARVDYRCSVLAFDRRKTKVPILSTSNATCLWVATQEGARGRHRQPQGNQKHMGYPRRLRITVAANWNSFCGGGFPALPPFASAQGIPLKLLDIIPLAQSHTALALGTDWSPRSNSIVAFEGELQQHAFNDSRRRLLGYLPDTAPQLWRVRNLEHFTILTFT